VNTIDQRVADLVRSPVARYFLALATVGYHAVGKVPDVRIRLAGTELAKALTDPARLVALACETVFNWQYNGHAQDHTDRLAKHADLFADAARTLAEAPAAAWWWHPLDRTAQTWIGPPDVPDGPLPFAVDFAPGIAPCRPREALYTSTTVGPLPGTWLCYAWEGLKSPPFAIWHVPVRPEARIYEIHRPDDWTALSRRYPAEVDGLAVPDWLAVADDYDAVHLSMAGFLTATRSTTLRHWDSESTLWFRAKFSQPSRLPDWTAPTPVTSRRWPPTTSR
jgi:hypothetical protein